MEMKKLIAQRIRELRKQSGLSQQQVADALGVDRSAYTYFENGATDIKLDRLMRLSDIFSVSVDQMLPKECFAAGPVEPLAENSVVHEKGLLTQKIDETSLLLLYRRLPPEHQLQILAALQQIFHQE